VIATVAEGPTIDRVEADYRASFKRGEQGVVDTLRMLKAAVKNASIAKRSMLDEAEVVKVVQQQIKQRQDSLTAFESGSRLDLAAKERAELTILSTYAPAALTAAQLSAILDTVFAKLSPTGPADFGKVMGAAMKAVGGRADGTTVQTTIRQRLSAMSPGGS
jgi:hypothetical protein